MYWYAEPQFLRLNIYIECNSYDLLYTHVDGEEESKLERGSERRHRQGT